MNISATDFDYNYHNSQQAGGGAYGEEYVLHNVDVFNEIKIGEHSLTAVYQTGMSFDHQDYKYPSPKLALSEEGGANELLVALNELYESDFDDSELIGGFIDQWSATYPEIADPKSVRELYDFLNDNLPSLSSFLDLDEYTDNFEDYNQDEESGHLTLK